ncbi:hypothetical protein [Xanthomonas euvesicatoria]|nr:hypothetical protein [Xanthomonas euvesicatoria]MBV6777675.1 hypothetical protein [Xanthomonas campestris pv. carissae]
MPRFIAMMQRTERVESLPRMAQRFGVRIDTHALLFGRPLLLPTPARSKRLTSFGTTQAYAYAHSRAHIILLSMSLPASQLPRCQKRRYRLPRQKRNVRDGRAPHAVMTASTGRESGVACRRDAADLTRDPARQLLANRPL